MSNLQKQQQGVMQMISEGASKVDLVRTFGNLTMKDCLENHYPAISALKKASGGAKVENALALLLVEASSYFDKPLGKDTALELSAEVCTAYYYLSLEDVYACLQQLKRQEIYGKLTPHRVLTALEKYRNQRLDMAAQNSLNQHLAHKENRLNYDDPEKKNEAIRADEAFQQFKDQYNSKNQNS